MQKAPGLRRLTLLSILSLAGIGFSLYLTGLFHSLRDGSAGFKSWCDIGDAMNCDVVASSQWAELIPGFPLSSFGAGWFAGLLCLSIFARFSAWSQEAKKFLLIFSGLGAAISLFYFIIMATQIHTWCLVCLFIEAISLICLILVISLKPKIFEPADRAQRKTLIKYSLASVVATVLVLKVWYLPTAGPERDLSDARVAAAIQSILDTPPMTVPVGPESLSFGPQDAPVTIVEFSDFQCPHCRFGAQRLESLLKRFPKQLRVVMKSYPLDPSCNRLAQGGGHRKACEAAKVAYCAKAQGKLKEVYAALFENQESMEAKGPQAIAIEAGLDAGQLSQCLNSAATSDLVLKDIEAGSQYNIQGTPTFFINGRKVEAPLTVSAWTQLIEQLLKSSNR